MELKLLNLHYQSVISMKGKPCKNRIIIPDLIKKMKSADSQKQNQCSNIIQSDPKMKVSHYLNDQSDNSLKDEEVQMPTNQSTYRACESQYLNQQSSIKSVVISEAKKNKGEFLRLEDKCEFLRLEGLVRSEKMFINPDNWGSFMDRAMGDDHFHKALNGFLYNYFIQHYN